MTNAKIFFDGATGPRNPGHGSAGWEIEIEGEESHRSSKYLGNNKTNNESEYIALYLALQHGLDLGIHRGKVSIYGDSQLVIYQVTGEWKNKKPHLRTLMQKVHKLLESYDDYTLEWVPRDWNGQADHMSKQPLVKRGIATM